MVAKDHGRTESRSCRIISAEDIEDKSIIHHWPHLRTLVEITSEVDYGDHQAVCVRHYISDDDYPKAAYFNMLARGHWAIENNLHWCLDVAFGEDASRARRGYAAQNLSLIRKLSLQLVKTKTDKHSVKKRLFRASIDPDYLDELLNNVHF